MISVGPGTDYHLGERNRQTRAGMGRVSLGMDRCLIPSMAQPLKHDRMTAASIELGTPAEVRHARRRKGDSGRRTLASSST